MIALSQVQTRPQAVCASGLSSRRSAIVPIRCSAAALALTSFVGSNHALIGRKHMAGPLQAVDTQNSSIKEFADEAYRYAYALTTSEIIALSKNSCI